MNSERSLRIISGKMYDGFPRRIYKEIYLYISEEMLGKTWMEFPQKELESLKEVPPNSLKEVQKKFLEKL